MNKSSTIKTVKIRGGRVNLTWVCPICGKARGKIFKAYSYIGSQRFEVDGWQNDCGHLDSYKNCLEEACNNGLNSVENLEYGGQIIYAKKMLGSK